MIAAGDAPSRVAPAITGRAIGRMLGAGGTAAVWAVADDDGLAIKVPHLRTDAARSRMLAEATAMRVAGAPPAPRLVDVDETTDGRPALVMQRLTGHTLADALADLPIAMAASRAVSQFAQIVDAVATLHAAGLVHRDLKPENVFVCHDRDVRLLDLGLALGAHRGPAGAITQAGAGTLEYAAPEQLRGDPIDASADVYALGVILFELLALRPPFVGDAATIKTGHLLMWPPRLDELVPAPPALVELIARCLAKAPGDRPRDARALASELPRVAGWTPTAAGSTLRRAPSRTGGGTTAALLAIEGAAASSTIGRLLGEHGGFVARRRKGFALAVFEHDSGHTLERALRAAHALVAADLRRVVVHVASIQARPGSRLGATGPAIDRPESWLPALPDRGVVLSAAAIAARRPGGSSDLPLLGRDDAQAALHAAMTGAFAGDARTTAIIGPPGSGRSRMLREAATLAEAAGASVIAVEPGPHRLRGLAAAVGVDTDEPLPVMAALGAMARERRVAVMLDDTEPADELAALLARAVETTRMWLCLAGDPEIAARLRGGPVIELAPLDDDAAGQLLVALLEPCVIPAEIRARLVAWGERTPGVVVELAAALRAMGIVHPVPGSELWEIDAAGLDQVPASVPRRWLADRQLDALPPALAELLRVAAALDIEVDDRELAAVLRELVRTGAPATSFVDPATGLTELVRRGLLVPRGDRLGFRGEAHRAAVAAGLGAEFATSIHRAALAVAWRSAAGLAVDDDQLRRIAVHAGAIGERAVAAAAHVELATRGESRHAYLGVERDLTAALALADTDPARRRLLLGRARARRMSTRYEGARDDVGEVRVRAREAGCVADEVEAVLSLAAICDQTEEHATAEALIGELAALPCELPPRLTAFLHNRRGVVLRRAGRIEDAARELEQVRAAGDAADGDVLRGSLLLLSRVLAHLGRSDEGLAVLDEAIAACEADGDHFHLVAGLLNRIAFWNERCEIERAVADADRGRAIARDMGFVQLAIWIDHNLSIALWWAGDLAGATAAAQRAHDLGVRRFVATPNFTGTIQLALFLIAARRTDEARGLVERIRLSDVAAGMHASSLELLELACDLRDPDGWIELLARTSGGTPQDRVEALWLHAGHCSARGERERARWALREAIELARAHGGGIAEVLATELAGLPAS